MLTHVGAENLRKSSVWQVDEFNLMCVPSSRPPVTGKSSSPKSICFPRDPGDLINHHLHDTLVLINLP